MSVVAVGHTSEDGEVAERAVVIVAKENAGLRIDGNVDIWPAVVIEIIRDGGDGVAWAGF